MTPGALEAKGLSVRYRGHGRSIQALTSVDLLVGAGESVGIVGESGCGKSTLARAMIRLLPPAAEIITGDLRWGDCSLRDISDDEMRKLRATTLAFIPQASMNALNPALRLRAQFRELLSVRAKMSKERAAERAKHLCEMVGVDPQRLGAYPHQLSGGMRQRMVLAMAIALDPQVVIADEATTGLDAIVQTRIINQLAELQQQRGFALLYISHDFGLVLDACERIVVMYAGMIVETGPTEDVYDFPTHPYTMGLRNSLPTLDDRRELTSIAGSPPDLAVLPTGCRFADRCPFAIERCHIEAPALVEVGGRSVACHRASEADELRDRAVESATWNAVA